MLGLLAHGLHLLLVVLGLVGVVVLLLPQIREARVARRTGVAPFRPPATREEHEQRVAALRSAARSGQLTAPQGSRSAAARRTTHETGDPRPWRAVATSSSMTAAVVHAAVFPSHLQESLVVGAFFFVVAGWQAVWAFQVSLRATHPLLVTGIVGNLGLVALWACSRTLGLPFGLGREPVGPWDAAAVSWQLCLVGACFLGLRGNPADGELPMGRLDLRTWSWVLFSVGVLVLLSLTASHE
jgi:hypothetical protein